MLPKGCAAKIELESWPRQPVFNLLQKIGNIPAADLRRTFNLGIGMVFAVSPKKLDSAIQVLKKMGQPAYPIGQVVEQGRPKQPRVIYQ